MNYYQKIKEQLLNNEINRIVKDYSRNLNDLNTYFNVGKLLYEYQNNINDENTIKECSAKLTKEIGKGYSITNLKNMMKFYKYFKEWETIPHQLNWSHYIELLSLNNINEIQYYIKISLEQNLSYRELHRRIKSNEYYQSNTKKDILSINDIHINKYLINHFLKIINQQNNKDIKIKILKKLILENITTIINILGDHFCYIDCKYKVKINKQWDYIDLLLYNIESNCYTVVKFKIDKTNTKDISQIKKQMNYIDKYKKLKYQNETTGLILCKKNENLIVEYYSNNTLHDKTIINIK